MKKAITASLLALTVLFLGCAADKAPSGFDRAFFDIQTNEVELVELKTNIVDVGGFAVTNVTLQTNIIHTYDLTPNENVEAIAGIAQIVGDNWGMGGVASTVLAALFGIYAQRRSSKSLKTAGVLAQIVETGRKVLTTTQQGKQAESEWVKWMSKHETETGVIMEVADLLKNVVDQKSAQTIADELIRMAEKSKES